MEKINLSRTLIEVTVSKMLREIQSDPGRSIRKLLDLAQSVSQGRFQKRFFETAQTMMENEDSAYYEMVTSLVAHTDHERLKTFGINLGYNGCTIGAKLIRQNEGVWQCDIPWYIHISVGGGAVAPSDINRVIGQGKALGIYVYSLLSHHALDRDFYNVLKHHADCAFVLLTEPDEVLETVLDVYADLSHCLWIVNEDGKNIRAAAAELTNDHFFFGTYRRYTDDTIERILSHEALTQSAQYGGTFLLLCPDKLDGAAQLRGIESQVCRVREQQQYPFIVIDMPSDALCIDRIISDTPCAIAFDAMGQLLMPKGKLAGDAYNFLQTDLKEILQKTNPKKCV